MSEHVSLNDVVYFTANFYHPVSGFSYLADSIPAWYVYESGASQILSGSMTQRNGITGSYWGNFTASTGNGFVSLRYYDVQVSGAIDGISGFIKVKEFVVDDVFDANVVSVSGVLITSDNSMVDANVVQVSGEYVHIDDFGATAGQIWQYADRSLTEPVSVSGVPDVNVILLNNESVDFIDLNVNSGVIESNIVSVSGNIVHINDFKADVSGLSTFNPAITAVAVSGIVQADIVQVSGEYVHIDDFKGVGSESGGATAEQIWQYSDRSLTEAVSVSGIVDANIVQMSGQYVSPESVVDANIVSVSGVPIILSQTIDANLIKVKGEDFDLSEAVSVSGIVQADVVQVSGEYVHINDFKADLTSLDTDIYFAQIKYISDTTNNADEFAVQWFRNDQPISSGELLNPAISVYNTSNGNSLIINESMSYASPNIGVVRYNKSPMVMASGEPYLIEASGIIDSISRVWKSIVGIDLL